MQPNVISTSASRLEGRENRSNQNDALAQACIIGLAFGALSSLVALGATRTLDWWGQRLLCSWTSVSLDVVAFLCTLGGEIQVTGALALFFAWRWWRRRGVEGLGPLLLLVGVGFEVLLKYTLVHPGPPADFSHPLRLPSWLQLSTPLLVHVSTPYSFPSGHLLRTTFLARLAAAHQPRWRTASWLVVGLMAFTRLYGNEHWLSDVVGGVLLGWSLAALATALSHRGDLLINR
jgi:membrane-associated phospholipid phosphatase